MTSIYLPCTVGVPHTNRGGYELLRPGDVGILQTSSIVGLGSLVCKPPVDDGEPQHEAGATVTRVEAGQLSSATQPVPDRVRVHEQHSRGGLQRVALLKVGGDGVEQGGSAAVQRL